MNPVRLGVFALLACVGDAEAATSEYKAWVRGKPQPEWIWSAAGAKDHSGFFNMSFSSWRRQGMAYRLNSPEQLQVRMRSLKHLRAALMNYDGKFPPHDFAPSIPANLWESPARHGTHNLYAGGLSANNPVQLLAAEPVKKMSSIWTRLDCGCLMLVFVVFFMPFFVGSVTSWAVSSSAGSAFWDGRSRPSASTGTSLAWWPSVSRFCLSGFNIS
ncbi:MAG: hypothetical protein CMO80_06000 [Verrucomicrobiales bacterium]|nr:hypothetical protein [Verrucomicrobiales bacterium]